MSGLGINVDKTKAVKIGVLRDRSLKWEGKCRMEWTNKFTVLGIDYNVDAMGDITTLNVEKKITDIKKLIRLWQARKLSPYGKVTVIKSLFLSKITHLLLSLPSPKKTLFNEINTLFKNFLWNNKPPKFRKEIIEADIPDGGVRLHNLEKFDLALKLGWAKRLLKNESKWTVFPTYWDIYDIFTFGPDRMDRIEDVIYNPFCSDFIKSVKTLFKTEIITHMDVIHEVPIWLNPNLRIDLKKIGLTRVSEHSMILWMHMENQWIYKHSKKPTNLKPIFWNMVVFVRKSNRFSDSKISLFLKPHYLETAMSML